MELLNLDELANVDRYVTVRGKRYAVYDRTVGHMLESVALARRTEAHTEEEFLEAMLKTVKTIIPDCPEEVVRSLSLRQMTALLEFVNRDPAQFVAEAQAEAEAQGKTGEVESVKEQGE